MAEQTQIKENQNRNGWLRLAILIIIGLTTLSLLVFVFGYIPYSKFKNDCIDQISKQHFNNTIVIDFKAATPNNELAKITELKYRLSLLEDVLSVDYMLPADNAKRFHERIGKQLENAGVTTADILNSNVFNTNIEIKVGDKKDEKYFQDAINKKLIELQLKDYIDTISIHITNKQDYLKAVNFLSFLKLKISPRAQDIGEFYKISSDCDLLQITPMYGVSL